MVFQNENAILIFLASRRRGLFPVYAIHGHRFRISFSPRLRFEFHHVFVLKMFTLQTGSELINTKFIFKRSKQIKTKTMSRTIQFCHAREHGWKSTAPASRGGCGLDSGAGSQAALQWAAGHWTPVCFVRSTFCTHGTALTPVSAPLFHTIIITLTIQLLWFFLPFPQT